MIEEKMGAGFEIACLLDRLTDDYEIWNSEPPESLRKVKSDLYVSCSWDCEVG